jgi:hypothetical protein
MRRAGHRRPHEKWERVSVLAVAIVAILAITLNHAQSVSKSRGRSSTGPTVTTSHHSSSPTTAPIPQEPLSGDDSLFSPVAKADTDFTGKTLNSSLWSTYSGPGNQGVGTRSPSAITVNNGLTITARGTVAGGMAENYSQTYGRWEVRAQMEKGAGYGPAILLWPDSEKWPTDGELDIVELPQGDRSEAAMTSHYGTDNLQQGQSVFGDFSQWHTYAVDWLPNSVTFYIDGVARFKITDPAAIPSTPHHLAIQNDVGAFGSFIGCRDASTPPTVALHVSSVRVFKYTGKAD